MQFIHNGGFQLEFANLSRRNGRMLDPGRRDGNGRLRRKAPPRGKDSSY